MKVELQQPYKPQRGCLVEVGNVYVSPRGRPYFKIVMGIISNELARVAKRGRWNNIVLIHVDPDGNIIGASCLPEQYVRNHQDLVGKVTKMPSMKIEWLKEGHGRVL